MKKSKLGYLFVLSTFILFLVPNTSASGYVGVTTGDEYTYEIKVGASAMESFMTDISGGAGESPIDPTMEDMLNSFRIKIVIGAISGETTVNGTLATLVNITILICAEGICMTLPELIASMGSGGPTFPAEFMAVVFNNETSGLFTVTSDFFFLNFLNLTNPEEMDDWYGPDVTQPIPFLIMAADLDWSALATSMNAAMVAQFGAGNAAVTALSHGIKTTLSAGVMDPSQEEMEYRLDYTPEGMLKEIGVYYDSDLMLKFGLTSSEEEIPGYELAVILGISMLSSLGLIYYVRKKKRII